MENFEKQIYSQNGEDGVIKHIFDNIGFTNKIAVEFGVSAGGGGGQANTRLLAEEGWKVFWFDCDPSTTIPNNCTFTQARLTSKNISSVFESVGVPLNFDLLSIDVDGNDYHLREALKSYNPRVCVMEYNGCFDGATEYIMKENDEYVWRNKDRSFGASLKSLSIQAERLGYDLVYCDKRGVNSFFIKSEINPFQKKSSEEAYRPLYWAWR
jgi:hypothetical protein